MPFVSDRWLGGTLTNFRTIRSRLTRLEELEAIRAGEELATYSKKMQSSLTREYRKMYRNLNGMRTMNRLPECLVVIDPRKEKNAVREARKLGVTTVALIDTDCDPDEVDLPIPGNDDSIRSIELIVQLLADAVLAGKNAAGEVKQEQAEGRRCRGSARMPVACRGRLQFWRGSPRIQPHPTRVLRNRIRIHRYKQHNSSEIREVCSMAEITAAAVKELRERTGLPMMDCKRALTESGGDSDKAIELLAQGGQEDDGEAGRPGHLLRPHRRLRRPRPAAWARWSICAAKAPRWPTTSSSCSWPTIWPSNWPPGPARPRPRRCWPSPRPASRARR